MRNQKSDGELSNKAGNSPALERGGPRCRKTARPRTGSWMSKNSKRIREKLEKPE
jgi:hypothetical protein